MSRSIVVLTLFIGWALFLLVLMETIRAYLVMTHRVRSDAFRPDNAGISPFMERLARAHANCIESLPLFGGLLLAAVASGRSDVTDPLAGWLLGARLVQSSIHLASTRVVAINARFAAFVVQMAIAVYWVWALLV